MASNRDAEAKALVMYRIKGQNSSITLCNWTEESMYRERVWPDTPVYGAKGCLYRVRWDSTNLPPIWDRIFQQYRIYRKAIQDLQEANQIIQNKYDEVKKLALELETVNRQLIESKEQLETYTAELEVSEISVIYKKHAQGAIISAGASFINDLLDLGKLEAGKMELEISEINLKMLVENSLSMVRRTAEERGIRLNEYSTHLSR